MLPLRADGWGRDRRIQAMLTMFSKRSEPFKGLIATHLWTYLVILEVGLASAGLAVAELESLFAFRAQPKKPAT